jgi:zinc transporter ZupT
MTLVAGLVVVLALAGLHLAFPRFDDASERHRATWTSFAGGISIGYVFLHLLPKLARFGQVEDTRFIPPGEPRTAAIFITCMAGLLAYMLLGRRDPPDGRVRERSSSVETAFLAAYGMVLGAVLAHPPRPGLLPYAAGVVGVGGHVLAMDHQLRHRFRAFFDRTLRHVLAGSLLVGFVVAAIIHVPEPLYAFGNAFVGGMILVAVMREEIPADSRGRTLPLLGGVALALALTSLLWVLAPLPAS